MMNIIFEEKRKNEIQLQGIGWKKAIPAGNLKPGTVGDHKTAKYERKVKI